MKTMANRTPEERRTSAAKGRETRRRNRDVALARRANAFAHIDRLNTEIEEIDRRLASLKVKDAVSGIAARLTGNVLLRESQIVEMSQPWNNTSGVYFLVSKQRVVYVGQSVSVYSRIASHKDKDFDCFAFVPCSLTALDKLESLYIHFLLPALNGNCTQGVKMAPIKLSELLNMPL